LRVPGDEDAPSRRRRAHRWCRSPHVSFGRDLWQWLGVRAG
jgi:hypothetical protein